MSSPDATPDVLETMQALWALAHALEERSKWMQRTLGITGPQRLLLRAVGAAPGCTPSAAARRLRLNPGTVSRLMSGLQRNGLLKVAADPRDGRQRRLSLTPRGVLLNGRHHGTVEAAVREALETATPSEASSARRFVLRLTASLTVSERERREGERRNGGGRRPGPRRAAVAR